MNCYRKMIHKGVRPIVMPYNALLTGTFQAGKVEDARKLFGEM